MRNDPFCSKCGEMAHDPYRSEWVCDHMTIPEERWYLNNE